MGEFIRLTAPDGHRLNGFYSTPEGKARGGVIVASELFGVNHHMQDVCDRYAAAGYVALAPCFYDRIERSFAVGYTQQELEAARVHLPKLDLDAMMLDSAAVLERLSPDGKVGMVGFCSGGSTAWYAASHLGGLACAVSYYGGRIPDLLEHAPKCPVLLHWGDIDHTISMDRVRATEAAWPDIPSYVYEDTKHGFNCDRRAAFNPVSSALATERTMAFFAEHVG